MKKRYLIAGIFTGLILQLTHHVWLGSHGDKHFDLMVMLIILICSFLLGLKLTSYLADFKDIKNKSRIEIIFLSVFFLFLIIPVLNINQSDKSDRENRMLATYQPLIKKDRLNKKYGKDFEAFFNDRFNCRKMIISYYHFLRAIISVHHYETSTIVYIKNKNFVIAKKHEPKPDTISYPDIDNIVNSINRLNNFCLVNGIKLYVLVVPYNQYLYQDLIKPYDNPEGLKVLNKNINTIISKSNAKIIYPFDEFVKYSGCDRLFFKTDHHWTDKGAFIGYKSLMRVVVNDFPNVKQLSQEDFNLRKNKLIRAGYDRTFFYEGNQLAYQGFFLKPLFKGILDTKYDYFYNKNEKLLTEHCIDNEHEKSKTTYYPKGANYRVVELGTSMNENLLQFVSYTFKNVKYLRLNNVKNRKESEEFKIMKYYKKEILDYHPDIMVLCITTLNVKNLNKIFDEE